MTTVVKTVNVGIRIQQETLDKLEKFKGYHSRNKFLVKLVDEGLACLEEEQEQKGVRILPKAPTTNVSTNAMGRPTGIGGPTAYER
jgi:hypothetical protein